MTFKQVVVFAILIWSVAGLGYWCGYRRGVTTNQLKTAEALSAFQTAEDRVEAVMEDNRRLRDLLWAAEFTRPKPVVKK